MIHSILARYVFAVCMKKINQYTFIDLRIICQRNTCNIEADLDAELNALIEIWAINKCWKINSAETEVDVSCGIMHALEFISTEIYKITELEIITECTIEMSFSLCRLIKKKKKMVPFLFFRKKKTRWE